MNICMDVVSTIADILIAASVAYVAYQSYKIEKASFYVNKNQFRLSLFDRRYKVFEAFRSFLQSFSITAKINNASLSEFYLGTIDTEFLFGKEVVSYRENFIKKCNRLKAISHKFKYGITDDQQRTELAQESSDLEEWFVDQNIQIKELFKKYLHFSIQADPMQ